LKADEATRDVPIIFISALDDPLYIVRAFEIGGMDYITKPFQPEEVLARGIAHDFNNILSAIIGNTEIAMMHELPEGHPARYSMEQVRQAANRATDLVRQILAFSRQKQEEFKPIRIRPVVKEVIKLLRASLPSTIEIGSELTAQANTILGDPSQIHQILMKSEEFRETNLLKKN